MMGGVTAGAVVGVMVGKWVLSRAEGSNGTDRAGNAMILPQKYLVDYVRIYEQDGQ